MKRVYFKFLYLLLFILFKPRIHLSTGIGMLYQFDRYDLFPPDCIDWWSYEEMGSIYDLFREK